MERNQRVPSRTGRGGHPGGSRIHYGENHGRYRNDPYVTSPMMEHPAPHERAHHLHHPSPQGPAVSVYPRSYSNQVDFEERQAHHRDDRWRNEEAKFVQVAGPTSTVPMVEIAPEVFVPLRGASETWSCVKNDCISPAMCFSCNLDLFCILDADFVLCPECHVVSPVALDSHPDQQSGGGVGLGMTFELLATLQQEICRSRK